MHFQGAAGSVPNRKHLTPKNGITWGKGPCEAVGSWRGSMAEALFFFRQEVASNLNDKGA
jgi:hypothetical protein